MKKNITITLLTTCLLAGSVLINSIDCLTNLSGPGDLDLNRLIKGHIVQMFHSRSVWSNYPALVHPENWSIFINLKAIMITAPGFFCVGYFLGRKKKQSFITLSLACLSVGFIPYFLGLFALHNNTVPENAGPWIAIMLLGLLYSISAACVCLILVLLREAPTSAGPAKSPCPAAP